MKRPTNYRVTEHGLTYRICAAEGDRVLFIARKNRKSGETVLMYGADRFRHIIRLAEKLHERTFHWKAYV